MAFLQGVKGVLPSEHRPRPGSLGFIAQAEEQAGPPAGCPRGEVASGLPTRSPPLSESAPLGPRPPLDGLRPRSKGAVSLRPLWASPLLGVAGPSGLTLLLPAAAAPASLPPRPHGARRAPAVLPPRSTPPSLRALAAPARGCFAACTSVLRAPPPFFRWARSPVSGCVLPTAQNDAGRGPRRRPARSPIRAAPLVSRGHTSTFTRTG